MEFGGSIALWVPFLGTVLGAAVVLGLPMGSPGVNRGFSGLAGGMMLGAAVGNLLVPGWGMSPAGTVIGLVLGLGIMGVCEGKLGQGSSAAVVVVAVVLHNIPEGLAVGFTGEGQTGTVMGIALQNIPDGAVAAMPLVGLGMKRRKAFFLGALTGAVEPVAALMAMVLAGNGAWLEPGMMGFAAGAMIYVVIRELMPRMGRGWGVVWWFVGMVLMNA